MDAVHKISRDDVDKALEHIGQDDRFRDDANMLRAYIQSLVFRLALYQDDCYEQLWAPDPTVSKIDS